MQGFGNVRREVAEALAIEEDEKYDTHRRMIESADIDELTESIKKLKP